MSKPITAKIDVTKILKEHIFAANSGAKYLDLVIWPNRDGAGKYGDTHYIVQGVSKEAREREKGPIIGNLKFPEDEQEQPRRTPSRRPPGPLAPSAPPSRATRPAPDPDLDPADSDIPF